MEKDNIESSRNKITFTKNSMKRIEKMKMVSEPCVKHGKCFCTPSWSYESFISSYEQLIKDEKEFKRSILIEEVNGFLDEKELQKRLIIDELTSLIEKKLNVE